MVTKSLVVAVFAFVIFDFQAAIADPCDANQTASATIGERYVAKDARERGDDQPDVAEQAKIGGTPVRPLSLSPDMHKDDLTILPPQGEVPMKMADQGCR